MSSLPGKAVAAVQWFESLSGGVLLFLAAALVFAQIVLRALGFSVGGLYEIATFCMIWSVFLVVGVGIQRNIHVRVDVLLLMCPPPLAWGLRLLSALLMLGVAGVLCGSGWLLIDESLTFGDRTLGMLRIPMWIPQLIMPLSGVLMLVHAAAHLVEILRTGPHAHAVSAMPEVAVTASGIPG